MVDQATGTTEKMLVKGREGGEEAMKTECSDGRGRAEEGSRERDRERERESSNKMSSKSSDRSDHINSDHLKREYDTLQRNSNSRNTIQDPSLSLPP